MTFSTFAANDWWIVVTALLCNTACALLGCFLVLRRLSLLGDAISHSVLPGLAVAFLFSGSRAIGPMLAGAVLAGLLTALLTSVLHRWGRVPEDAAMGVVFTSLFAIGVILIARVAPQVDLDPGCVLYGAIEYVPFDPITVLGLTVPRSTFWLGVTCLAVIAGVTVFYKELKIVSFDPFLATAMGINARLVHYGLMTAVAVTAVAAFESVGSILVVAMLIAPAAAAHLLTDRLSRMLFVAVGMGALTAVFGYERAAAWNNSTAGMMSVVAGALFGVAVLLAPRHGILGRLIVQASLALRIIREDILGMLYRWEEAGRTDALARHVVLAALGRGRLARLALWRLVRRGRVAVSTGGVSLTPAGRLDARRVVRAHRLWESYLEKHLGLPLDHLHEPATRMEHFVTQQMRDRLAAELEQKADPHGREIPG